jgi:signal transduction histidine kinase
LVELYNLLPLLWGRSLAVLRILLAGACILGLVATPGAPASGVLLIAIAFLSYAFVALFWKGRGQLGPPLLALILDTIFFLLCVTYSTGHGFWVSSFFYFYLLLTAALFHTWREVLMEAGVCLVYFYVVRPQHSELMWPIVLVMGLFACVVTFHQRALAARLTGAAEQAVLFRAEAEHAREAERQRIAADFHDGPLQSFISFQMRLEVVKKMLQRDLQAGLQELGQLQEICKSQVAEFRSFVKSMRPVQYGETIGAAFRRLSDDFQNDSTIPVSLVMPDSVARLEMSDKKELVPLVREALHNIQKHSRATRVSISVAKRGSDLQIEIVDDGEGFPFGGAFTLEELERLHLGPVSIQRRIRNLNGGLTVESRPGRGATLKVDVPA